MGFFLFRMNLFSGLLNLEGRYVSALRFSEGR